MPNLPSGTVTFVFSDLEGSTALLKQVGDEAYSRMLARHRQLVRETFAEHEGREIDTQGDAFFYSFSRARAAVAAAVAVQRAHAVEEWPGGISLRVRLGLHTGEPLVGDEGYAGLDVVRASRIAAHAQGGQVLLSEATRALVAGSLPNGVELVALGERRLKDIESPEALYEVRIPDLPALPAPPPRRSSATGAELVDAALAQPDIPDWVRGAARRYVPAGVDPSKLIEERVLAQLERAFRERESVRQGRDATRRGREAERQERRGRRQPPSSAPPGPPARNTVSVADEIAKLQALRESGALSEEQYQRAVERAIESGRRAG